eukprot:TRINITY_DN926_c0_g1_i3.p1 TRINITY_DN926_c0_g1~~TRINITY_DN926_c0_g1_i3.p1  ORF type:complete len:337 (-),score=170.82 TRINITY_DN926_c0_g1_i3:119-1129(-)
MNILHGEQYVEQVAGSLPAEGGSYILRTKLLNIYDKIKGAVLRIESTICDNDRVLVRCVSSIFIRGLGNFGGDRGPANEQFNLPNRAPDAVATEPTNPFQALLYRLSGDYNPLHVDQEMASMVGFPKPILHGLCTYGFAARAVLKHFCDNDSNKFKSISARFSNPVLPGDTLVTEMWRQNDQVLFHVKVLERNLVVITNGIVQLQVANIATNGTANTTTSNLAAEPELKSAVIFEAMGNVIAEKPELRKQINCIFQFHITGPVNGSFVVDLKQGKVEKGVAEKADCTITISDDDYFDMATGKLNPQKAFVSNKMKITGNIMLATKLQLLQKIASSL